jgi:hypothetical protein
LPPALRAPPARSPSAAGRSCVQSLPSRATYTGRAPLTNVLYESYLLAHGALLLCTAENVVPLLLHVVGQGRYRSHENSW